MAETKEEICFKHERRYRLLGRNIAFYRIKVGISQLTLAEVVDISRTHMSNIEAERLYTPISLELLYRFADALEVDVSLLLDFSEEREEELKEFFEKRALRSGKSDICE